jgi:hypothetical protein
MVLAVFLTITLLTMYIVFFITKKFSFLHNSILFMVLAIISKNYFTVMTVELELLKITQNSLVYLTILLQRDIITPLLCILFVNLFFQLSSWNMRLILWITIIGLFQAMDLLMTNYFRVVNFINWNMYLDLLVNVSYTIIVLGTSMLLTLITNREGKINDSYL